MVDNHQEKVSQKELPSVFLTGYLVGAYPTKEKSIDLITKAVEAGLDAVEIGIPSTNPFLDGDVIKRAHAEVIDDFHRLEHYISFLQALRNRIDVPIWIMGYYTDLTDQDLYLKLTDYVDGFVMPDVTMSQLDVLEENLVGTQVKLIPVINDSMSDKELLQWMKNKDVLYCQLYKGKTGKSITNTENFPLFAERIKKMTDAKLMGGFGINSGKLAGRVYQSGYDGIVVGSEIMRLVEAGNEEKLFTFIKELARAKRGE